MTTQEVAELFLAALYDLAEAAPHPNFLFSVNEFAPTLGLGDKGLIMKAFSELESRGFVFCASMDAWGGISAGITPDGAVYVEKGGESGIIERYRKDPMSFRIAPDATETTPLATEFNDVQPAAVKETYEVQPRQAPAAPVRHEDVEGLLSQITGSLWRDGSLTEAVRQDLLCDLETLKLQAAKQVKNRAVIGAMIDSLSRVPSLALLISRLASLVLI